MPTVCIIGGGFAGCAAALAAAWAGAEALLVERTDMLTGLGLITGVLGANGSTTAILEAKAMAGGDLFEACEAVTLHEISLMSPFELRHVRLFNVLKIERKVTELLHQARVKVLLNSRATDVDKEGPRVRSVILADGNKIPADAFVDATGSSGGVTECTRHGLGCGMCSVRCPTFGDRVSITAKAGARDLAVQRPGGKLGVLSRAVQLIKESLSPNFLSQLEKDGHLSLPMPEELKRRDESSRPGMADYLRVVHNGQVKISGAALLPLAILRALPGLEDARLSDPLSGGTANMVWHLAAARRDDAMRVEGLANLYCAGEKAGPKAELAPVVASGLLAGHNAVRNCLKKDDLIFPPTTALGDFFAFERQLMGAPEGPKIALTFESGPYWQRMRELALYTADPRLVNQRVEKAGWRGAFSKKIVD